ncbi:MAG: ABC transporter substrate-binding protein, partial [Candidatus Rokubacteria bacterium]|nr:ABC transporter substrate-binding protein [Candidatus Rokubacteria bacterium]
MRALPLKLLVLGLAAVIAIGGLAPAVPAAEKAPIKIGLITPKTGNFAQMGIDMADGFKLYLSEIDYLVAGRKIELVEEDEGAQPAQAVAKIRKLVTHDKVNIVVGLFMAAAAYAAAPVAQEAEVPLIITIAASDDLTQRKASKYLARVSFTGGELGHAAGDYAYKKLGWRKVSAIAMDYGWGHEITGSFQRVFEELGGQVIQKIWTPVNAADFGPYVASLKPEADGILDVVTGAASIRLIGELRKAGVLDKKKVLAAGSATDETLLSALGDSALGVLSFYPWSAAIDTQENKLFLAKIKQATKKEYVGTAAAINYGAAMWITEALKTVGGDVENKEKFFQTLRATEIKSSPRGPIKID